MSSTGPWAVSCIDMQHLWDEIFNGQCKTFSTSFTWHIDLETMCSRWHSCRMVGPHQVASLSHQMEDYCFGESPGLCMSENYTCGLLNHCNSGLVYHCSITWPFLTNKYFFHNRAQCYLALLPFAVNVQDQASLSCRVHGWSLHIPPRLLQTVTWGSMRDSLNYITSYESRFHSCKGLEQFRWR